MHSYMWIQIIIVIKKFLICLHWVLVVAACGIFISAGSSVVSEWGLSCPEAHGILLPSPGIELASPALEVWIVNHWTTREVLDSGY